MVPSELHISEFIGVASVINASRIGSNIALAQACNRTVHHNSSSDGSFLLAMPLSALRCVAIQMLLNYALRDQGAPPAVARWARCVGDVSCIHRGTAGFRSAHASRPERRSPCALGGSATTGGANDRGSYKIPSPMWASACRTVGNSLTSETEKHPKVSYLQHAESEVPERQGSGSSVSACTWRGWTTVKCRRSRSLPP